MEAGFLQSGFLLSDAGIDFMVHGVFQYSLFGQKVWITTTHVCLFTEPSSTRQRFPEPSRTWWSLSLKCLTR